MDCKEIFDNVLSREGLYKNIPDPFATTDLTAQENIRVMNQLIRELTIENSLSDLLEEATFRTYKKWESRPVVTGEVLYSGLSRYICERGGISTVDPASSPRLINTSFSDTDGIQWKCLGACNQYPFEYIADDIASIDTGTVMNMSQGCAMTALNAHQWATLDANSSNCGTTGMYCVKNNSIYLFNGLADDTEIKFAYYTSKPVISGGKRVEIFGSGNDTCKIPALLLVYGTVSRYLSDKDIGNYEKFEQRYKELLDLYNARGQAPQQIDMSGETLSDASNYSDGDWNV